MARTKDKSRARKIRHLRVRKKVFGTVQRPRLNVYRSLRHIYAQIIDDSCGCTLVSVSTLDPFLKKQLSTTGNKEAARQAGELLAQRAIEKGIEQVVFDRGGYLFHGRVQALAEGARNQGLKF